MQNKPRTEHRNVQLVHAQTRSQHSQYGRHTPPPALVGGVQAGFVVGDLKTKELLRKQPEATLIISSYFYNVAHV